MSSGSLSVWLPRVIFESALITASILLALALDEWREEQQNLQTVEQAMSNFLSEIRLNKARVDDAAPFNKGLRDVLASHSQNVDHGSVAEFVSIMESYSPVVLQSTAWETALATGSVTKMKYNLVAAMSLTYGMQDRYEQATGTTMSDLMSPQNLSADRLELSIYNAVRYLGTVTAMESELSVAYEQAEEVIRDSWIDMRRSTVEEYEEWAAAL